MQETLTALVTGANRGIGLETCRQLAARGYKVFLSARNLVKARQAVLSQSDSNRFIPVMLDISDAGSINKAYREISAVTPSLDALINNAAIDYDTDQDVLTADLDRARRIFEVNTLGTWRVTQTFLPLLKKARQARIVNVSSESGSLAGMKGDAPAYSLSKAALNALTKMTAAALRDTDIKVNAICPGWVATEMGGRGGRPVPEGAAGVVWGATLPDDGPTGGFFRDGKPLPW